MSLNTLITSLPKVELHNHLLGSASPETVLSLARRHPDRGVPTSLDSLRAMYEFRDFAHFIEVYHSVDALVTTPDDIADLVAGAARDAAASKIRWMELTVTAATHLLAGLSAATLKEAVEHGRDRAWVEHGVEMGFIFDIPAERGRPAADATIEFLSTARPDSTVAIGVAGLEQGFPRAMYTEHIYEAARLGLPAVIHAGESTGPETIWSALRDLHAVRIGHGTSAYQDEELVAHLIEQRVPLEVCITSNVRTNSVPSLEEHPVRIYLDRGVVVTIATDDAGMFATDLNREYEKLVELAGLTARDVVRIVKDGVDVSLAPPSTKASILAEINAVPFLDDDAQEHD